VEAQFFQHQERRGVPAADSRPDPFPAGRDEVAGVAAVDRQRRDAFGARSRTSVSFARVTSRVGVSRPPAAITCW
jgi:hypothetical protein